MRLPIGTEMIERAATALCAELDLEDTGEDIRQAAEKAIRAAFDGVPMTNYGVGLALSADTVDMVALINAKPTHPALVLCELNGGEHHAFDSLPCNTHWQFGDTGLRSFTVSKIGVDT